MKFNKDKIALYQHIHEIMKIDIMGDRYTGKFKIYQELNENFIDLYYSIKPLLKWFKQDELQDYCKWTKTNKLFIHDDKANEIKYRGFEIAWCDYQPVDKKKLIYGNLKTYKPLEYFYRHVAIRDMSDVANYDFKYIINVFIPKPETFKLFIKEIDKILLKHNLTAKPQYVKHDRSRNNN